MHTHTYMDRIRQWCETRHGQLSAGLLGILAALVMPASSLDGLLIRDIVQLRETSRTVHVSSSSSMAPAAPGVNIKRQRLRAQRLARMRAQRLAASSSSTVRARIVVDARPELRPGPPLSVPEQLAPAPATFSAVTPAATEPEAGLDFPAFIRTVHPVSRVPHWGAMTSPAEWERPYNEMESDDFVGVPAYDMAKLTVPFQSLIDPRNNAELTRKLYYSTHYFGAYDVDAEEFTGAHAGIDLKLALGTPIGAVAGGRVQTVATSATLGNYVIIEHRHTTDGTFYSVYAHFSSAAVREGDAVAPGQTIGFVGMTGRTSGPHLHLQIDRDVGPEPHRPYGPSSVPTREEAALHSVNPITFIQRYAAGE